MFQLTICMVALIISGFTAVAIWGLLPRHETDNFVFRTVVWMSTPVRGTALTRAFFIAIPILYFVFFKFTTGLLCVGAMFLLTVFSSRYVQYVATR